MVVSAVDVDVGCADVMAVGFCRWEGWFGCEGKGGGKGVWYQGLHVERRDGGEEGEVN